MRTLRPSPGTIDEYIAGFPDEVQGILKKIRQTIKAAAPDAEETIRYQIPTFTLKGNLVHFAAFKKHIGFYPTSTAIERFKDELSLYEGAKGTVRFPLDKPIPLALISKIVKFRIKENLEKADTRKSRSTVAAQDRTRRYTMDKEKKEEGKVSMEEMMEVYKRLATPGAPHKTLASLAGSWTTRTRGWMEPDKPPMEGTGTCEQRMLLDGRYLQQEYMGEMMGDLFAGFNIIGYDNYTRKYVSIWLDSMSTGIYYFEGSGSTDGKIITQESSYEDPVRGPMVWRSITKIVDINTVEYEMYLIPKGGMEEKMMEMIMTRKK
jgi:uncharacterized protein YdhG (YjbR/CyaY superfamily)